MTPPVAATIRDRIDELYRSESRGVSASLVRLLKDFDLADDAMHEAYAAAIESWQRDGVPAGFA
jgi:RNA polymerase sigma-70 factor (ECF subfamily)